MKIKKLEWIKPVTRKERDGMFGMPFLLRHKADEFETSIANTVFGLRYRIVPNRNMFTWTLERGFYDQDFPVANSDYYFSEEEAKADAQKHWEETLMKFIEA